MSAPWAPAKAKEKRQPAIKQAARFRVRWSLEYGNQAAADRSLGDLDELLARQANQRQPPDPIYTASIMGRANSAD
jgi:hypothetical protein